MAADCIDAFWAYDFFGCGMSEFQSGRDVVCPHLYLSGWHGVFIMKVFGKFVVSTPEDTIEMFVQIANHGHDLFDPDLLHRCLKDSFERYIGPSWIGYPATDNIYNHPEQVQILSGNDKRRALVFEQFKTCCDETEWSHSGIDKESEYIAVQFLGDLIVSAASYEKWGAKIAHIGIITHPQFRNKGYAKNVLSAITGFLRRQGFIPQYRTLSTNIPAVKTAVQCAYIEYASHIAVRLK